MHAHRPHPTNLNSTGRPVNPVLLPLQDRIFVDVTGCPGFAINLPGFSLNINLG
jgi:hypothetical protein